MQAKDIVKLLEDIAVPILEEKGLEFVDAEFVKEGASHVLRLIIDKEGSVGIDECVMISRLVDEKLGDDITELAYTFEVSSPGLDRVLKREHEYQKYKGREVEVKLFKAREGTKEFSGTLEGLDEENNVVIKTQEGETLSFPRKEVATTRLAVIL